MRGRDDAYGSAVGWMRSAPVRVHAATFAGRAFVAALLSGLGFLSIVGLLSPASFVAPGSRAFAARWPSVALGLVAAMVAAMALLRLRHILWLAARGREAFRRPLSEEPHYDEAATALAATSDAAVTRFGVAWVWGPALLCLLATVFAWSAAYFAVDAILASFRVGWQQAAFAVGNALLSLLLFRLGARRLLRWRLAASVHRSASIGFV